MVEADRKIKNREIIRVWNELLDPNKNYQMYKKNRVLKNKLKDM